MKAITIAQYGGPEVLRFEELEQPRPKPDEVVVRVHAASVNPIDWRIREGAVKMFIKVPLPAVLGCDLAGEVVEVGSEVKDLRVGQEVYAMMPHTYGAQAEYVALPANLAVPKPAGMTMEQAASVPATALTALQALRDVGQLSKGQRLLVNGASGGVGIFAVQLGKVLGAHVTAVCSAANARMVEELGADRTIDYRTTDFTRESDQRYHLVFDCVSRPFADCKRVLEKNGIYVTATPGPLVFLRQVFNSIFAKQCCAVVVKPTGADLAYLGSLFEAGKLRTVIDRVYAFDQVVEAQNYSKTGHVKGKIVLRLTA